MRSKLEMAWRWRRRSWPFHLLTVAVCGFFAARAAGQYLSSAGAGADSPVLPEGAASAAGAGGAPLSAGAPLSRDIQTIVGRNLFCAECAPVAAGQDQAPRSGQPVRTALPLRLVATLIDTEDSEGAAAALLDTSSGRARVAAVGDRLALEARLVAVEERRILLENGGRKEYLPLEETGPGQGDAPGLAAAGLPAPLPGPGVGTDGGVREVGPGRYEVSRGALEQTLANTALLARMARIIPAQVKGQPAGFMLDRIRPGSLYTQLGLQDGDIIQAVSGRSLRTPEDALLVMTALRRAGHVTVSFLRRSRPITHDYTIR